MLQFIAKNFKSFAPSELYLSDYKLTSLGHFLVVFK